MNPSGGENQHQASAPKAQNVAMPPSSAPAQTPKIDVEQPIQAEMVRDLPVKQFGLAASHPEPTKPLTSTDSQPAMAIQDIVRNAEAANNHSKTTAANTKLAPQKIAQASVAKNWGPTLVAILAIAIAASLSYAAFTAFR